MSPFLSCLEETKIDFIFLREGETSIQNWYCSGLPNIFLNFYKTVAESLILVNVPSKDCMFHCGGQAQDKKNMKGKL